MKTYIKKMQDANRLELRDVAEAIRRTTAGRWAVGGNTFSPKAILAWFFTWTICAAGFVVVMMVVSALARVLRLLV